MKLQIWNESYSLQWKGTYFLALSDYPNIQDWELEKIVAFLAYEKLYVRETLIDCEDKVMLEQLVYLSCCSPTAFPFTPSKKIVASTYDVGGNYVYSDFLSHTCTVETAQEIFMSGQLLSAVRAFNKTHQELVQDNRNAAGDPEDYFDYVMLGWSNTSSGYRLAMERLLGREPTEEELGNSFIPGVSFHFKYDDIVNADGYVFDGYHPAKVRDCLSLKYLFACIVPSSEKSHFETIIPLDMSSKVYYLDYGQDGMADWSQKVYQFVENIAN
ncbi:phosphate ABC transporter ATPase [Streptococcus suis]|uniref:phosphate ABC transporter ATPase n=1 Tax=Streptococcus suis TaxID=1307 RepID=UPI00241009C9|nr:phosphate ABC transporter ATPase [Streptococcus suis]